MQLLHAFNLRLSNNYRVNKGEYDIDREKGYSLC
jgi:hypothetical protein